MDFLNTQFLFITCLNYLCSVVYLFERQPGSSDITYKKLTGPPDQFLPEWYIREFPQYKNKSAATGDSTQPSGKNSAEAT